MTHRKVAIAIIGAGTAGLSAYKEAKKYTDSVLVIDNGPLGSTCARVGCMPSKLFIQTANEFHRRRHFSELGIEGAKHITVNLPKVMRAVRQKRDQFTAGVIEFTKSLGDAFLCGKAVFKSINTLQVGKEIIEADSIIIATGSSSMIPEDWQRFQTHLLTSETLFEQTNFSHSIGVIGTGSIGLELGQAFARLGLSVSAFNTGPWLGGLSDPKVNEVALAIFQKEFSIHLQQKAKLQKENNQLYIQAESDIPVEQVLLAMGRKPNLAALDLASLNITLDAKGMPNVNKTTMQIENYPIFMAGDVNGYRPLLHEAADEGRIAAFNALNNTQCFKRRTPLRMIFTDPNIVVVGKAYQDLDLQQTIIGNIDFSDQGRAKILHQNQGLLRVYAEKNAGLLLGAEMIAPGGEHLGHLLAWAVEQKMTVFDMLKMPFYHPVLEEGMRTALRQLSKQVEQQSSSFDLALCDSEAIHSLS